MDDLISRQAAIEALGEEPYVWDDNDEYTRGERAMWKRTFDAIKTLTSAQQWIPCTERPPEDGEEVLITTSWDAVHIAWHDEDGWNEDMLSLDDDEVKAWMPLPEPWKGETDEPDNTDG